MKKLLILLLAVVVLAAAFPAMAGEGLGLFLEKQDVQNRLYRWAWYNITDKNYYATETWQVREVGTAQTIKIIIHYCGPETMMRLSPVPYSQLKQPCLVNWGTTKDKITKREIFVLRGHLPNGELFTDPALADELFKRYQDIRATKIGL